MNTLALQVSDELTVNVIPNAEHEYLMTTKEVAFGYGVDAKTIRWHLKNHFDELIVGKHFVKGVNNTDTLQAKNFIPSGASNTSTSSSPKPTSREFSKEATLWTKRGIVRLGFFIKSEKAKLFRDWAEDLIIYATGERQDTLEQRLEELEHAVLQLAPIAPNLVEMTEDKLKNFFQKWIFRGDLSRLAESSGYAYRYLQAERLINCF
ncbi:MAG: hypothetical protein ACK5L5_03585 [Bacteroidales bacterium]